MSRAAHPAVTVGRSLQGTLMLQLSSVDLAPSQFGAGGAQAPWLRSSMELIARESRRFSSFVELGAWSRKLHLRRSADEVPSLPRLLLSVTESPQYPEQLWKLGRTKLPSVVEAAILRLL